MPATSCAVPSTKTSTRATSHRLFFKRISDVYDEETAEALELSEGDEDFAALPENHSFEVPELPLAGRPQHRRERRQGHRRRYGGHRARQP